MADRRKGVLGNWEATGHEILEAMQEAVNDALREHKRAGRSVVVWDRETDRIVILRPDQIEVSLDEEPTPAATGTNEG